MSGTQLSVNMSYCYFSACYITKQNWYASVGYNFLQLFPQILWIIIFPTIYTSRLFPLPLALASENTRPVCKPSPTSFLGPTHVQHMFTFSEDFANYQEYIWSWFLSGASPLIPTPKVFTYTGIFQMLEHIYFLLG